MKKLILPKCYPVLLLEAGEDNCHKISSYYELLHMLDIKSISMSTMYRWFNYLGFNYNENKRSYYTDRHEREDVVRDRNDTFLVDDFKAERCCYHWVQIKRCRIRAQNKAHQLPSQL